ncbi:hypothetical protein HK103_005383 [Boothiomyces macroporosus]|uniref:Uncharacterized protein n=1 Tax=Boothiomyces macroporosus TaxID=261099 RepID=A0AAD5UR38_9FUNG|nr:hypothetical protein HK103_005383 [Boothiomyces macroporosus]
MIDVQLLKESANLQLNINDFSDSQIQNHKLLFTKLKELFLEKGHQAEWYKLVSGFTPQYKSADQVNEISQRVQQEKQKTKEYRLEIEQKKEEMISLSNQLQHLIDQIQLNKQQLFNDLSIAKEKEQELLDLQIEFQNNDELLESEKQELELMKQLEMELKKQKEQNDKLKKRKDELLTNNEELKRTQQEAAERELEAKRISEMKDPKVEELGKWFKEQLNLLYRFTQTKINTLSDTKFQIFKYFRLTKADHIEYQDVLEIIADMPLNEAIGTAVTLLNNRVKNYLSRKSEMQVIVENGGIFDDELLELLVQAESGRAFVLKLDPNYPLSGLEHVKVVGIEPQEYDDEKLVWTEKIRAMDIKTVTELLPLLE